MIELLSPAGNFAKLKTAILFGADAVYAGLEDLSLRAAGLAFDELIHAAEYCHITNTKFYLAINTFAYNTDVARAKSILPALEKIKLDALIISDPGLISLAKEWCPSIPIHLSTQANTMNWKAAEFWYNQGVKRIVLARELSLDDISEIKQRVPKLEIEIFVHGAMCMAFSGRCLISHYLTGRSANHGDCAQPCRWEFGLVELDPKRKSGDEIACKERPIEIVETNQGTHIMNAKDLCLITKLPEIIAVGVDSIKVEGRMKPEYYVALTSKCYKEAIMLCSDSANNTRIVNDLNTLQSELEKVSHRPFMTNFLGDTTHNTETQDSSNYIKSYEFVGVVQDYRDNLLHIAVRNRIRLGDSLEIVDPQKPALNQQPFQVKNITNLKNNQQITAAHNQYIVTIPYPEVVSKGSILRHKTK